LSLRSTAQPSYARFPIILSSWFSEVTIGYYPSSTAATASAQSVAVPCSAPRAAQSRAVRARRTRGFG
jgi:hypothetical protein